MVPSVICALESLRPRNLNQTIRIFSNKFVKKSFIPTVEHHHFVSFVGENFDNVSFLRLCFDDESLVILKFLQWLTVVEPLLVEQQFQAGVVVVWHQDLDLYKKKKLCVMTILNNNLVYLDEQQLLDSGDLGVRPADEDCLRSRARRLGLLSRSWLRSGDK